MSNNSIHNMTLINNTIAFNPLSVRKTVTPCLLPSPATLKSNESARANYKPWHCTPKGATA